MAKKKATKNQNHSEYQVPKQQGALIKELAKKSETKLSHNFDKPIEESGFLCDNKLRKSLEGVITQVISYVLWCKRITNHLWLEQKPVRPLSIVLFGPPGAGKSRFAKTVARYVRKILIPNDSESKAFMLGQANLAEYEKVELLGQQLVRLRNEKIDSDYPPMLFVDEADSNPYAFIRLLTMLWDGKFFWDVQERTLGSMIIFLAASTVRCEEQFDHLVLQKQGNFGECGEFNNDFVNWKCKVHPFACPIIAFKEKSGTDSDDPWHKKGSDFLSRINGPVLFLEDLTQEEDKRKQLFESIVKTNLKNLGYEDVNVESDFLDDLKPRYGVRSLDILAESLDIAKFHENYKNKTKNNVTLSENNFGISEAFSNSEHPLKKVAEIHFPEQTKVDEVLKKHKGNKSKTKKGKRT